MTSSGMKRGLAVTAVSALAVTGLPFLTATANAQPLSNELEAQSVALYTQQSSPVMSIKDDGQDTNIHLLAGGGAAIEKVRFEYTTDGSTWTTIATANRANGAFSYQWAPAAGLLDKIIELRATGIDASGFDRGTDGREIALPTKAADSINISNAAGSAIGVFEQPYDTEAATSALAAVSGTTSDVSDDAVVTLNDRSSATASAPTGADWIQEVEDGATSRTWRGSVDLTGYNAGSDIDADQVVVGAAVNGSIFEGPTGEIFGGSDDAEALTVYDQTITTVTATAAKSEVQAGKTTSVTVTVLDQKGKPVSGAQVFEEGDEANALYTGSDGKAVFEGVEGAPTPGAVHQFVVNTTDDADYQDGTDFRRSVTITSYAPVATTITGASADGAAFDRDEYADGDIVLKVADQKGELKDGEAVRYFWTVDAFLDGVATTTTSEAVATDNGDGTYDVVFPNPAEGEQGGTFTLHSYINRDNTPGQQAADLDGANLVVKAGEADVVWNDGSVAQAGSSTTKTLSGKLVLADGTALAKRDLDISWATGGDAELAPQNAQPAGVTRNGADSASTKTDANGAFSVALRDPNATPLVNEYDGVLTATPVGNTDAESSITVEFLTSLTPDQIYIDTDRLFEYATPGRPVSVYATVFNANGDELTDQQVEVSVNHGFLTPFADERRDLTPAQAPKVGDVYGYWKDLGDDEAETTDDSGNIANTVNIERDAGFDDDGEVTMTVTIKAGPVTEQREIDFNTLAEPLNPGSVSIELANPQSVEVLPNAPTTEAVYYDVVTKDQFANRTEDWVDVSDDSATAMLFERENWDENPDVLRLDPNPGAGYFDDFQGAWYDRVAADDSVRSNFTAEGPALAARSDAPATQKITGEWSSDQKNWVDTNDDKVADDLDQGNYNPKTVSDTTNAIKWYMINFAASKYSLGSGDSTRTIGDTVHSTFSAEDQMGEPIEDMAVKFFRTGPDDLQDGDGKDPVWTDSDGNASYIWQGAKAGKATVTSVVRTPDGALVPSAELSSSVTFKPAVAPAPAKRAIAAKLTATNQRNGNDRLFVNAPSIAKTAKVTLYKVRKNGSLAKVSTARLNRNGNKTFVVKDVAKRAWTKYVARVSATAKTKADTTPRKRVR